MNAPLIHDRALVRVGNLADAEECARIDGFVMQHADSTSFHLSAWVKGVEAGTGQKAHVLIAENALGAIEGVLPLHAVGSPLFGKALVSSGFAVGGGILAASQGVAERLADAAWKLAKACKSRSALTKLSPDLVASFSAASNTRAISGAR